MRIFVVLLRLAQIARSCLDLDRHEVKSLFSPKRNTSVFFHHSVKPLERRLNDGFNLGLLRKGEGNYCCSRHVRRKTVSVVLIFLSKAVLRVCTGISKTRLLLPG